MYSLFVFVFVLVFASSTNSPEKVQYLEAKKWHVSDLGLYE